MARAAGHRGRHRRRLRALGHADQDVLRRIPAHLREHRRRRQSSGGHHLRRPDAAERRARERGRGDRRPGAQEARQRAHRRRSRRRRPQDGLHGQLRGGRRAATRRPAGTTYSSVVAIKGESSDAELAAVAANSYAAAFIQMRKDAAARADRPGHRRAVADVAQGDDDQDAEGLVRLHHAAAAAPRPADPQGDGERRLPRHRAGERAGHARIAPKPLRSAAIGLALGLFVGLGLAFLLELLDTSVRTRHRRAPSCCASRSSRASRASPRSCSTSRRW